MAIREIRSLIMMIDPNSLDRQKEGAQGEEDEEAGVKEREDRPELRCQARTLRQVQLCQGYRMRGIGENMDGGVGF